MLKVIILTLALWQLIEAVELPDEIEDLELPNLNDAENEDVFEELPNLNDTELEDVVERTYRFMPFQLRDKVYAVNVFTKADWFTAQKICSYQGMNLASVRTSDESDRLRRYLFEYGLTSSGQTYWVSGTDLGSRGQWYWMSNGLPITYTNWYPGEPNNAGGNERCLQVGSDGRWNDLHCEAQLFFICENRCQLDSYSVPTYPPLSN